MVDSNEDKEKWFLEGDSTPEEVRRMWMQHQEFTKLTENHQILRDFVGFWDLEMTMRLDEKSPPWFFTADVKTHLVMQNRFLESLIDFHENADYCQCMILTGFDNVIGHYMSFILCSELNGIGNFEGTWSEKDRCIRDWGEISNPQAGFRENVSVYRFFREDGSVRFEMRLVNDSTETRLIAEGTMTRKQEQENSGSEE